MRSVILSGGRSCFVACPGCYNHFSRELIDTVTLLRFVGSLRGRFGLDKITVGGGDPLTRPDIVALLSGIRALGLRISLDTVGSAFLGDAEIRFMGRGTASQVSAAEVSAHVDVVGIPFDGASDAVMRKFRKHSSVADQQSVLRILDSCAAFVCVNTVVHAGNLHDLERIARLIAEYRCVRQWQLFQFMPIGPLGWRNRESYAIDERSFSAAVDAALASSPDGVEVMAKSAAERKNRYLLVDTEGMVWIPEQVPHAEWSDADANGDRRLVGRVGDPDIMDRVEALD